MPNEIYFHNLIHVDFYTFRSTNVQKHLTHIIKNIKHKKWNHENRLPELPMRKTNIYNCSNRMQFLSFFQLPNHAYCRTRTVLVEINVNFACNLLWFGLSSWQWFQLQISITPSGRLVSGTHLTGASQRSLLLTEQTKGWEHNNLLGKHHCCKGVQIKATLIQAFKLTVRDVISPS